MQRLTPRQPQRSAPSRSTAHPPFPLPGASAPRHHGSAWHPCVFESIPGLKVCFKIKIPSQNARKRVTPGHGKSRRLTPSPPCRAEASGRRRARPPEPWRRRVDVGFWLLQEPAKEKSRGIIRNQLQSTVSVKKMISPNYTNPEGFRGNLLVKSTKKRPQKMLQKSATITPSRQPQFVTAQSIKIQPMLHFYHFHNTPKRGMI